MLLVDAEALLLKAIEEKRFIFAYEDMLSRELVMETVYHDLAEFILSAPAVDAIEVVRCKDCKFHGWEQDPCHGRVEHFCKLHKGLVVVNKETFCCYGERKDNEAD